MIENLLTIVFSFQFEKELMTFFNEYISHKQNISKSIIKSEIQTDEFFKYICMLENKQNTKRARRREKTGWKLSASIEVYCVGWLNGIHLEIDGMKFNSKLFSD